MAYTSKFDNTLGCKLYTFEQVVNCNARPTPKQKENEVPADNASGEGAVEEQAPESHVVDNAKWTKQYIDSLPDESFAVIETGYKDGENKDARHLPYKDADGKIDISHLKNAWDRHNQIKSVLGNDTDEDLRDKAEEVLEPLYKKYVTGGKEPDKKEDKGKEKTETADNSRDIRANNSSLPSGIVKQNWRLISAVQAWPSSDFYEPQMVDYGHEGGKTLKSIISLVNQSKPDLLWNHSHDAHDVAGYIDNASWEDSQDIPAGVNAELVIDPQFDYKAALGVQTGLIKSGSIGVTMDCRPSHEDMPFEKFISNQGKTINGNMVRWLPIKIQSVRHMALLPSGTGADPNAGLRVSPDNQKNKQVNNKQTEPQAEATKKEGERMADEKLTLLAELAKRLGIEVALSEEAKLPEGLAEKLSGKIDAMTAEFDKLMGVKILADAIVSKLDCKTLDEVSAVLDAKLDLAKCGEKLLDHFRKEAVKWFDSSRVALGKTEASEAEKRIRARIENSEDLSYLEDVALDYRGIAENGLSSKRTSEGVDITAEDKPVEVDQRSADIEASVNRMFSK